MPAAPLENTPPEHPYANPLLIFNQPAKQGKPELDALVPHWLVIFIAGGICWYLGMRFIIVPFFKSLLR